MCNYIYDWDFPDCPEAKNLPAMQETQEMSSLPGSERSPGERNSSSLQCSCLEKSVDRRA